MSTVGRQMWMWTWMLGWMNRLRNREVAGKGVRRGDCSSTNKLLLNLAGFSKQTVSSANPSPGTHRTAHPQIRHGGHDSPIKTSGLSTLKQTRRKPLYHGFRHSSPMSTSSTSSYPSSAPARSRLIYPFRWLRSDTEYLLVLNDHCYSACRRDAIPQEQCLRENQR